MSNYDNTNRIALWGNDRKRPGKQDKDYNGTLTVQLPNGETVEYYVSLWNNQVGTVGSPVMSGTITPKEIVAQDRVRRTGNTGNSPSTNKYGRANSKPPF